ncbi:m7GpppX diphosphatase-like [Dreissena polymorpha]|uniref:m7GpppX diphosphatase n=1 Tax=Dreissena polymorpha TaxID=45954 RepID=A0A9D4GP34_DREPO|nr:m7GpppX diphosphatase-like [Dreissena polymorpha]KAH3819118.1 hypothetical protein DPMN_120851 [Dreissena polymorpha]
MEGTGDLLNKKRKLENSDEIVDKCPPVLKNFKDFNINKVIAENPRCKTATIHGQIAGEDAVVLLEKTAFDASHLGNYLSELTTLNNTLKNDIYGTYDAFPPLIENAIRATVIHPATEKHIKKYTDQPCYVVHETPELYTNITLPLIISKQFSIQWVYNILGKKKEADRIVFEDPDPEQGFVLLPDMKWDCKDTRSLYLVAIVHKHEVKSLRDLTADSLPLLNNILHKGLDAIKERFGVPSSQVHVYLHYQPSYYHLHVHFAHVQCEAPGMGADRAHMLIDVIDNIQIASNFYQRKTLTFTVREEDDLYKKYKDSGYFDKS